MWPFKRKPLLEWVIEQKQVRRTVYFTNGQTEVSHVWESFNRQLDWPSASDYHFCERARAFDFGWRAENHESFLYTTDDKKIVAINRDNISKITYEVEPN